MGALVFSSSCLALSSSELYLAAPVFVVVVFNPTTLHTHPPYIHTHLHTHPPTYTPTLHTLESILKEMVRECVKGGTMLLGITRTECSTAHFCPYGQQPACTNPLIWISCTSPCTSPCQCEPCHIWPIQYINWGCMDRIEVLRNSKTLAAAHTISLMGHVVWWVWRWNCFLGLPFPHLSCVINNIVAGAGLPLTNFKETSLF